MTLPQWLSRQYGDSPRQHEEADAREMGGVRQPGSGNLWHRPMDGDSPEWVTDNKRTSHLSYSLKGQDFVATMKAAYEEGKQPRMSILFEEVRNPYTGEPLHLTVVLDKTFKELLP